MKKSNPAAKAKKQRSAKGKAVEKVEGNTQAPSASRRLLLVAAIAALAVLALGIAMGPSTPAVPSSEEAVVKAEVPRHDEEQAAEETATEQAASGEAASSEAPKATRHPSEEEIMMAVDYVAKVNQMVKDMGPAATWKAANAGLLVQTIRNLRGMLGGV